MTIQELEEHERRKRARKPHGSHKPRKRKPYHRKTLTPEELERRRAQRAEERRQVQSFTLGRGHVVVYPFVDWCRMRGLSVATGRRLVETKRVKLTRLSARRIGVRSDHDKEYLDSCLEGSA